MKNVAANGLCKLAIDLEDSQLLPNCFMRYSRLSIYNTWRTLIAHSPIRPRLCPICLPAPGELTNHLTRKACLSFELRQMERIRLTLLPNNLFQMCLFVSSFLLSHNISTLLSSCFYPLPLSRSA